MLEGLALVGTVGAADASRCRAALTVVPPDGTVVPLRDMRPEPRTGARIAIVANPDPADLDAGRDT